jgi:hypothetical protein
MIVFNWFAVGLIPILALLVLQIRRMAHRTPIFSYALIACAAGGPTIFLMADLFWLLAAFRPERDPRVAHFNLLVAAALLPASFVGLAMEGAIAWDGLLTFQVRNVAIGLWIVVMGVVLAQAIHRQRIEEAA